MTPQLPAVRSQNVARKVGFRGWKEAVIDGYLESSTTANAAGPLSMTARESAVLSGCHQAAVRDIERTIYGSLAGTSGTPQPWCRTRTLMVPTATLATQS